MCCALGDVAGSTGRGKHAQLSLVAVTFRRILALPSSMAEYNVGACVIAWSLPDELGFCWRSVAETTEKISSFLPGQTRPRNRARN